MAGAVDLFAGRQPIAGINLFKADKNPLQMLDMGIEDVIGEQGNSAGSQVNSFIQSLLHGILGLGDLLDLDGLWEASWDYLNQFFGDIENFLGVGGGFLGTDLFDLIPAIENFITSLLHPTDLLAAMDPILKLINPFNIPGLDATKIISGLFPQQMVENLTDDLNNLWEGILSGDPQAIIDAITGLTEGTVEQLEHWSSSLTGMLGLPDLNDVLFDPITAIEQFIANMLSPTDFFGNLSGMLGLPDFLSFGDAGFDPFTAVTTFITDMLSPTNLLAGLDPFSLLLNPMNIPGLDATKIITGMFPQEMITDLQSDLTDLGDAIASGDPQAIIDAIIGITDGTTDDVHDYFRSVESMMGLPDFLALPFDVIKAIENFIKMMINPTNLLAPLEPLTQLIPGLNIPGLDATKIISGLFPQNMINGLDSSLAALLGPGSALNALNLFNLVPTDLLSHIPMSNIGEFVTNMITDPQFLDEASLSQIPGWTHELTGGFNGLGAMFTTATGITKELFGNLIPVSEGQIIPISGMARWAGLVGTGNPIQLAITGYQDGVAMVQQIVASHNVTPPTTDWITLTGEFTVAAGIDSIRTRLTVGSGATAGTVGFSNLSATKTGAILQRLIRGTNPGEFLPDDVGHLFNGIVSNTVEILDKVGLDEFGDLVSAIGGPIGDTIDAVEERINTFLDDFSPLNGVNVIGTIADEIVPGIQAINDNLVNNLANLTGSGFSHSQVGQALRTQAAAITTMSGQLSQITNQLLTLGVSIIDDFGRLSSSGLGADWITNILNSNGHIAIPNGHSAEWIPGASNITNQFLSIFNGVISKTHTDIQNIVAVLSGQAQILSKGSNLLTGFNDVWARVSNTTTSLANVTGTRLRFGGNGSVSIDNFINGILTVPIASMPAGSITPPGPGAIIGLVAGFMGDLQTFGAMIGSSTVLIGNAPSNTPVGNNYLGSGIGGQATGASGAPGAPGGTAAPAPIFQYTAMDGGKAGAPGASG